jgi:hypothetical protein
MKAFTQWGEWITNATDAYSGGPLSWVTSRMPSRSPPLRNSSFSVVSLSERSFLLLSAHGHADLWSLCPSYAFRGQNRVVYNVSGTASPDQVGYDPKDCYQVFLHVVQVSSIVEQTVRNAEMV